MSRLRELYLDRNYLTGPIPPELGELTNLERLALHFNDLTGPIPPELGKLRKLKELTLLDNRVTGVIPRELGNVTELRELLLEGNMLTGPIPSELGNLRELRRLNLADNALTGTIPGELGNLTKLTHVWLSGNGLTGGIPRELGRLTELHTLFLSGNQLTGTIPRELGGLRGLYWLWLEGNRLTGAIPAALGNLDKLYSLTIDNDTGLCLGPDFPLESTFARIAGVPPCGSNWPPEPVGALPPVTFGPEDPSVAIDVAAAFRDREGDALTYEAYSSARVARVTVSGSTVTVTPVAAGTATITVTARDRGGRGRATAQRFQVTVSNRAPMPVGSLRAVALKADGRSEALRVSGAFRDGDGDPLTYAVSSSAPGIVGASIRDDVVTVWPVAVGTAAVTVTATDTGGSNRTATQMFTVTVTAGNQPPERVGTLAALEIGLGEASAVVDVSAAFRDPDGDELTYGAGSSAPSVAGVAASGSTVTVTPVASGTATVTVTATDAGGSNTTATQTFAVTVNPANQPPEAVGTLVRLKIGVDAAPVAVEVAEIFRDPDGDALTYGAASSEPAVAMVTVSGSTVTVTPVAPGTATVTVTATDTGGSDTTVSQSFPVLVPEPFTDDPIVPAVTQVKAIHFMELRTRIDALREGTGLERFSWTDPVLTAGVTAVRLAHVVELREALAAAYEAAGRAAPGWTDAAAEAGATAIRAAHVTELRAAVFALE